MQLDSTPNGLFFPELWWCFVPNWPLIPSVSPSALSVPHSLSDCLLSIGFLDNWQDCSLDGQLCGAVCKPWRPDGESLLSVQHSFLSINPNPKVTLFPNFSIAVFFSSNISSIKSHWLRPEPQMFSNGENRGVISFNHPPGLSNKWGMIYLMLKHRPCTTGAPAQSATGILSLKKSGEN